MANKNRTCNQICHWNDPSDGCVKPNGGICPISSAKVDAGECGQVKMANKNRLIDANALSDKVDESKHYNPHPQGRIRVNHRNEHDHFLRMIMDAPTVDAVEVVRCKNCKKWEATNTMRFDGYCHNPKFHLHYGKVIERCFMPLTKQTDFCSYGERKDNDV